MTRKFIPVYEETSEDSSFAHINPNIIFDIQIDNVDDEGYVDVAVTNIDNNVRIYSFIDIKEAQRFIKRVSGEY